MCYLSVQHSEEIRLTRAFDLPETHSWNRYQCVGSSYVEDVPITCKWAARESELVSCTIRKCAAQKEHESALPNRLRRSQAAVRRVAVPGTRRISEVQWSHMRNDGGLGCFALLTTIILARGPLARHLPRWCHLQLIFISYWTFGKILTNGNSRISQGFSRSGDNEKLQR